MKSNYIFLLVSLLLFTGCEDWLDINNDPNNPVDVSPDRILPAAQVNTAFIMGKDLNLQTLAIVQQLAGTNNQLLSYDTYFFNGTEADNVWFGIYAGALLDFKKISETASDDDALYQAISDIHMAYLFGVTTDLYGDVPFQESLQDIDIVAPVFDDQSMIYDGILGMLENAETLLNGDDLGNNPGASDLIYGGDAEKWLRLGNSLQVKYWLQQRKINPSEAASAITALVNGDELLRNNGDNFNVPFGTTNGNQHPLYDFAFNRRPGDIAISQRFIDSLNVLNDPRIDEFINDQGQGTYLGYENGGTGTPPLQAVRAVLGTFPVGDNGEAPMRLYTYYTQEFLLAEAALMLDIPGDARTYYENALTASLDASGVDGSDAQTYLASRLAAFDAAGSDEEQLQVVIRDKWVSQFGNGVESFNDWRRTGYPEFQPSSTPGTSDGSIPVRLLYSANELSSNPNLENQSQLIDPVWWDVD